MKKLLLLLGFTLAVGIAACENDNSLNSFPIPPPQTSIIPTSPTPGPTPEVLTTATSGCGNADYGWFNPNDTDDPPGQSDSWICIWYCTNLTDATHMNPPYAVMEEWDYDPPDAGYIENGPFFFPCGTFNH